MGIDVRADTINGLARGRKDHCKLDESVNQAIPTARHCGYAVCLEATRVVGSLVVKTVVTGEFDKGGGQADERLRAQG